MKRYSHKPEDLTKLFSHSTLAGVQQQFQLVGKLNAELCQILQLTQLTSCQVATIKEGRAIILCSSAAWATRLKMQRDAILDNFRKKILPELAGIDIEVSPVGQTKPLHVQEQPAKPYCATLSHDTRLQLQQAAAQTDGPVQQALQRLLRNMPDNTPR
ncbi:DciA family protein [Rheinheimera sp. UJ51]|uniref:DUF721 domain-containing protein n=1 Tax=Rheinheimera sp. UJ51 TaxID=2892446 RepID=UPI001E2DB45B|nr:DciA family protein [Rheinheimera sp. UJ51]MCC5450763.1 DciA family protein [Rheinheimera sp. UJ51]